jgi:hypothetical protein
MTLENQIESILPSLFTVTGSQHAIDTARDIAERLMGLADIISGAAESHVDVESLDKFRAAIMADKSLSPATKHIASIILDHVDLAPGCAAISTRQLVRLSGRGRHTPIRAIRALRNAGWFRVTRSNPADERRGAPNHYRPNIAKLAA